MKQIKTEQEDVQAKLAAVQATVDDVLEFWKELTGVRHYEGCWRYHTDCMARHINAQLRGEDNADH